MSANFMEERLVPFPHAPGWSSYRLLVPLATLLLLCACSPMPSTPESMGIHDAPPVADEVGTGPSARREPMAAAASQGSGKPPAAGEAARLEPAPAVIAQAKPTAAAVDRKGAPQPRATQSAAAKERAESTKDRSKTTNDKVGKVAATTPAPREGSGKSVARRASGNSGLEPRDSSPKKDKGGVTSAPPKPAPAKAAPVNPNSPSATVAKQLPSQPPQPALAAATTRPEQAGDSPRRGATATALVDGRAAPQQLKVPTLMPAVPSAAHGAPAAQTSMQAPDGGKKATATTRRKHYPAARIEYIALLNARLEMVALPGGSFVMGSSDGDDDERPPHQVSVPPFSIGRYEVTQRQWQGIMGDNPSNFKGCAECPVDSVSWYDIQQFISKLNKLSGRKFRLPSEAEWEYACRAGGSDSYCGEGEALVVAWIVENSGGRSQPVGQLEPNGFGLHDMSGNSYEWVEDCWHAGYSQAPVDGSAWVSDDCQRRVLRGGAWYYSPAYALSTYRNANTPDSRFIIYGFRLALDH